MLLSVIIPAYNVEPYIERCLCSLQQQDIPNDQYEIIVINDGSPDNLASVVEKMQVSMPNLKLINQLNQGVSGARNNAIKLAKGDYILAIDPDDYVIANSLGSILSETIINDSDISVLEYDKILDDGTIIWSTDFSTLQKQIDFSLKTFFQTKGENNILSDPDRSVAILYKHSLFDNLEEPYPLNVPFLEDAVFLAKIFCFAKSFAFIKGRFYQRTIRPGSATNSNLMDTEKARKGFEIGFKHLISFKDFINTLTIPDDRRFFLNQGMIKFMVLHLRNELQSGDRNAFENTLKNYNLKSQNLNLNGIRYPFNLLGSSIKYFPSFFPFIMKNVGRVNFLKTKLFS